MAQHTANQPKRRGPKFSRSDFSAVDDTPMRPEELAVIWSSLPESARYRFFLSIREDLADKVLILTTPRQLQKIVAEERTESATGRARG
jgi:hypothetical protein